MRRTNKNSVLNKNCHSRVSLSGISTLDTQSGADPRLQASGMTTNLNAGQARPDNRKSLVENNSCVAVPVLQPYGAGSEQQILRTSTLFNYQAKPDLHIAYEVSPSPLVGEGARRAGEGFPRAFTLIELLVVVLIIGILAAVALPQYQKAVEKSHAVQAMTLLKSFYQAYSLYHLANGTQPTSLAQLDIQSPLPGAYSAIKGTQVPGSSTSDDNWALSFYHNTEDLNGMCIVRTAGQYAGGGFCIWHDIPNGQAYQKLVPGQMYCIERRLVGVTLIAERGLYCEKLFHGKRVYASSLDAYEF